MAITFFRSAQGKVGPDFPFFDHLSHNLLLAYKMRIEQLLANQRTDEALSLLLPALALTINGNGANDDEFKQSFADTFQNLGLVFFENRQVKASVQAAGKRSRSRVVPRTPSTDERRFRS